MFLTINGFQFSKKLNFKKRKTLEFAIIFAWPLVKYCSIERWLRWYQTFMKKVIFKGTCPSLKLRDVCCDFSAQERRYGKFRMKALFLMLNMMTEKFFHYSNFLVNLGIKFESHHLGKPVLQDITGFHQDLPDKCFTLRTKLSRQWPKILSPSGRITGPHFWE